MGTSFGRPFHWAPLGMRWQSVVNCTAGSGSIAEGYLGRVLLNTIYSKVWNHALGAVVVASEHARSAGKGRNSTVRKAVFAALMGGFALAPLSAMACGTALPGISLAYTTDSLTCTTTM